MWNFRHSGLKTSCLSVNPESCRQTLLLLSSEGEALKENLPKKKKSTVYSFFSPLRRNQLHIAETSWKAGNVQNSCRSPKVPRVIAAAGAAAEMQAGQKRPSLDQDRVKTFFFLFVFQLFFQLFQKLRRPEGTLPPSPAVWRLNTRWWHLLVISWSCWSYRPAAPLMLKQKKQRHSEMKFCLKI